MYAVTALILRMLYSVIHALFSTRDRIVLLSRQSDSIPLDFNLLKECLIENMPDWEIAESYHYRQSLPSVARDVFLVATSRVCVLDSYNPAVSIPKVDQNLLVIQLWHALGAIKRFGWQAVGTSAGRPKEMAQGFSMHANYSTIIAAGKGCLPAYAEAFRCSEKRIIALGLPRMDYLLDSGSFTQHPSHHATVNSENLKLESGKTNIVYVPTFREREDGVSKLETFILQLAASLSAEKSNLLVGAHPFSSNNDITADCSHIVYANQTRGIDLIKHADYVITDYSAIAFEAALLGKKVLFYVPDIDVYRASPGLNIDVEEVFPLISFRLADELAAYIEHDLRKDSYEAAGFWQYCKAYLIDNPQGSTARIVDYIKTKVI